MSLYLLFIRFCQSKHRVQVAKIRSKSELKFTRDEDRVKWVPIPFNSYASTSKKEEREKVEEEGGEEGRDYTTDY